MHQAGTTCDIVVPIASIAGPLFINHGSEFTIDTDGLETYVCEVAFICIMLSKRREALVHLSASPPPSFSILSIVSTLHPPGRFLPP